jgi:hypothetical protein
MNAYEQYMADERQAISDKNAAILKERQAAFLARTQPKRGDVIRHSDGKLSRMSHVWDDGVQTTISINSGSFYLGDGYMEYSGGLESSIPMDKFTRTNETMPAPAWFFSNGEVKAHNGIDVMVNCPVWECDAPAPENWHETYWLAQIDPEHHERTCNYWYLITKGGTSWTAFTTAKQLQNWMDVNGLKLTQELAPVGEFRSQKLVTK